MRRTREAPLAAPDFHGPLAAPDFQRRSQRPRPLVDTWPLAATPVALALRPLWGAALLGALLVAWLLRRQARREVLAAAPLVAVAAVALLLAGIASTLGAPEPRAWVRETTPRYAALWRDLASHAADGVRAVGQQPPGEDAGRLAVHRRFAALLAGTHPDLTLLLVDPDGQPLVWEGRGLLHEPEPQRLPRQGFAFIAPASAPPRCSQWRRCRHRRGPGASSPAAASTPAGCPSRRPAGCRPEPSAGLWSNARTRRREGRGY